jgi:hypothetical protein
MIAYLETPRKINKTLVKSKRNRKPITQNITNNNNGFCHINIRQEKKGRVTS